MGVGKAGVLVSLDTPMSYQMGNIPRAAIVEFSIHYFAYYLVNGLAARKEKGWGFHMP